MTARSGVVGQDRAVSISPEKYANRSTATAALAKRDTQIETRHRQGRCHHEPPSRIDIARQSFSRFLPRATRIHLFAAARSAPLPRHPSLSVSMPFSLFAPSLPGSCIRPLYPSRFFIFFHLDWMPFVWCAFVRGAQPRESSCRECMVCARARVCVYACVCAHAARAFLRGCVGRVNSGGEQERKRLVSR